MKKIFFLSAALASLLSGCIATQQYAFFKPDSTTYETNSSLAECEYQVLLNKIPLEQQQHLIHLCMKGKGYRYQQIN